MPLANLSVIRKSEMSHINDDELLLCSDEEEMVVEEREGGGINPQSMITPGGVVVQFDLQPEEEGAVGGWPEDFRIEEATRSASVTSSSR